MFKVAHIICLGNLLCHFAWGGTLVKIMSFNILYGGDHQCPLDVTVAAVRLAAPDVVGVQEADGNGPELSRRLGYEWHPVAQGTRPGGIASRYPITKKFRQGAEVTLPDGSRIYVFSVHLRSNPYEPYKIRDGALVDEAEAIRSAKEGRGSQITEILAEMAPLLAQGLPVFLVGDFNEPSHLDWTVAAGPTGAKLHALSVRWPTSLAVVDAGMTDAYRQVHPDEVKSKGYTWTPLQSEGEVHDRIDFVYFAGASVRIDKAQVFGELGGADTDIVGPLPYPTDHRGVIGTFSLK